MLVSIPDGYFVHDLLYFGGDLSREGYVARGLCIDLQDTAHADNATKILMHQQACDLLASLGADYALQVRWQVEGDYAGDLEHYEMGSRNADPGTWCEVTRMERASRCRQRARQGVLRREKVYIYLSRKCGPIAANELRSEKHVDAYFRQLARNLKDRLEHVGGIFTYAHSRVFTDREHWIDYVKFFNPGHAALPVDAGFAARFRPERSIVENTFWGDGVPFSDTAGGLCGLFMDGNYHQVLVVREWPRQTEPDTVRALTRALAGGASITVNIYPCDISKEIEQLEKDRAELMKQTDDPQKFHLHAEVERKGRRITSLMGGQSLPFKVLMTVRIWDQSIDRLAGKAMILKTAFQQWSGVHYHQVNHSAQAKNLFFETFPGWLGGRSIGWHCEAESTYLADLLPLASTFVGHLKGAEILLDGVQGGLVGLRLFSQGTPQHACLLGMRGAGKSSVTMEVLSQTDHDAEFTGIIEEGMSYSTYAQLNGYQSLVLRPSAGYSWNYLDTQGLPLSPAHCADVAALGARLLGSTGDDEKGKLRMALLNEYVGRLYDAVAEDWRAADEERFYGLARRAWLAHELWKQLPAGAGLLEGYTAMREWERECPAMWSEKLASVNEAEVVSFTKRPETSAWVRDMIFSELKSEDFPTHSTLCSILRSGRSQHHRTGSLGGELDAMAALLGKWKANGGVYGPLVDGTTNISFAGKGLHVELGCLGDNNRDLKEVAGFLATTKMRQRVISMPRATRKRLIYEEVGKFLTVPGAAGILAENYAQFRKYQCWVLTVFQNTEQLDKVDPSLLKTIRANSTQYWFMRHQDAASLAAMGDPIGLPSAARSAILRYPLPEHQKGPRKASYFTLYSKEDRIPTCGTVRVEVSPPMLYVASSNGEVFDQRMKELAGHPRPVEAVLSAAAAMESKKKERI